MLEFDKKVYLLLSTCISMTGCKDYMDSSSASIYPKKEILAPSWEGGLGPHTKILLKFLILPR